MRLSRIGIILIITITAFLGANCSFYNQVIARKNLVDGADAYKNRKFDKAESLFRDAVNRADNTTLEGRMAQLFLARTLHSQFAANRQRTDKAEQAIEEYKKVLEYDPADASSFKAVASLYENLGKQDEWLNWVTQRANNENVPNEQRAEAYATLAAKKNTCANEISDVEPVKKTVVEQGRATYVFTKPEDPAQFEKLKQCVQEGTELVNKAVELDPNSDSAWSYKTSLLVQQMRIAEMEGNKEEEERLKTEADKAKERFSELAEAKRKQREEEERIKAEKEAANKKK